MSDRIDFPTTRAETASPADSTSAGLGATGLTDEQVAERLDSGRSNRITVTTSRSVEEIIRANLLTRFNLLVGTLTVVIAVIGPIQDAVFGLVMVINSAIGIVQELRSKRALDRLAVAAAPAVEVIRAGGISRIPCEEVVVDDLIRVGRGDQVIVDGVVEEQSGLEIDESLLTGESDPVAKAVGDRCLSGSAVVAGAATVRATRVGDEAYAARITREARRFELVSSELRTGTDQILRWVGWAIVPTAAILIWSQFGAAGSWTEAARGAIAGIVGMVPQGLVLLISVALAVGVARLARLRVLTQQLAALEGLARVDVLCFDKTGTITEGAFTLREVVTLGSDDVTPALAALAHLDPDPNATIRAIVDALPAPPGWAAATSVPFRSDRRWSGAEFLGHGTWVLGAPDAIGTPPGPAAAAVAEQASAGHRVVMLSSTRRTLTDRLPEGLEPRAIVVLGDVIRGDAAETVNYFSQQGVALKVISGDDPHTVEAVGREAGIVGGVVAGSQLPTDLSELGAIADANTVFGRVSPDQKRSLILSLRSRDHTVAMVGDGVNDVLAIKAADVGVAMGSGAGAVRAVAPLILVDGDFASMPRIVDEGRRVIGNIERVASLYVTKAVYAFLLAWAIGIAGWAFPLLPRHYTVIGVVTIGVPSFWLALEPTWARVTHGYVMRVLRFGAPVGAVTAFAGFGVFWMARSENVPLDASQATTTLALIAVGLAVLLMVARPLTPIRKMIVAAMAVGSLLVFAVPGLRDFYALGLPRPTIVLAATGVVALTVALMYGALKASGWWRELPVALREFERLAAVAKSDVRSSDPQS
ncbi:MAG: HAD-IC family P-type ATPase [Acidimicrobiia bacterium]|nr:HAD-IC family P-type ATPase [Acidimicrobiia bacterium]